MGELSCGANKLIQRLRTKYHATVTVVSLQECSFVVGSRCAVIRKSVSDLSQSLNRRKLADQLRGAHTSYDHVYLVAEKDRVEEQRKGWKSTTSSTSATKTNICQPTLLMINQGKTRVLYS